MAPLPITSPGFFGSFWSSFRGQGQSTETYIPPSALLVEQPQRTWENWPDCETSKTQCFCCQILINTNNRQLQPTMKAANTAATSRSHPTGTPLQRSLTTSTPSVSPVISSIRLSVVRNLTARAPTVLIRATTSLSIVSTSTPPNKNLTDRPTTIPKSSLT